MADDGGGVKGLQVFGCGMGNERAVTSEGGKRRGGRAALELLSKEGRRRAHDVATDIGDWWCCTRLGTKEKVLWAELGNKAEWAGVGCRKVD
jgi:hypothetical protein